jgi:hypothetical protein
MAYIERSAFGIIWFNATISERLAGFRNVERYAAEELDVDRDPDHIRHFLGSLAASVNALGAAGAYHSDLSGKNIFTNDGKTFYFIDLDAVYLHTACGDRLRLLNHVQLYDSFCDQFPDALLGPFIEKMIPDENRPGNWLGRVRAAQQKRRAITEAKWRKQGRLPQE